MSATIATPRYAVALPGRMVAATPATYRRRRLAVGVFACTLVASAGLAVQHGLADRGGDPASAAAIGQPTALTYLVQPGDTLWAIAERLHPAAVAEYVDALIALNHGTVIHAGQHLRLP